MKNVQSVLTAFCNDCIIKKDWYKKIMKGIENQLHVENEFELKT